MSKRVNLKAHSSELYTKVVELEQLLIGALKHAGIPDGFAHLLRLRASQLNGCAYCIELHARDALAHGETLGRIDVLSDWGELHGFTKKEKASLDLVESVTLISDGQVPDTIYDVASSHLSTAEIAAIEWLAIAINVWNRIAITSRY